MSTFHILGWLILSLGILGGLYQVAAAALILRIMGEGAKTLPAPAPAVSIFKPLYGAEAGLEEALTSVFTQRYPGPVQIVFGLHSAGDPAAAIIETIRGRFPEADCVIACDPALHGSNGKVSNLINMFPAAKHDILVFADADIKAGPDWLCRTVAALGQPNVGAVSCLYTGIGKAGFWSTAGAMAVAYHFLPNVTVGVGLNLAHPCFGSTIALRRDTLASIGGLAAFANLLADDFEIGRAVRAKGLAIAYPPIAVTHCGSEGSFNALIHHELRWARTIRVIDPFGHAGSFVTHALSLGTIGAMLAGFTPTAIAGLATIILGRLFLKRRIDHIVGTSAGPLWALPVRDYLTFAVFLASLTGSAVRWREVRLRVTRGGAMS